jgi:hypothetical protein
MTPPRRLAHPVGPGGRLGGQGGNAGLDKAIGADAARQHGGETTAYRRPGEPSGCGLKGPELSADPCVTAISS